MLVLTHSFIRDDLYVPGGYFEGWPCEGPLTQVYGKLSVTGSIHGADDIAVPRMTPLYAWADGEIRNEFPGSPGGGNGSFGLHVYMLHGYDELLDRRIAGVAAHCDQINIVPSGKRVAAGELIAYSGNTGLSTGPHVHFGFGDYPMSGDYRKCYPPKLFIDRAQQEENLPMAPYERGLLGIAYGDPTTMSAVYDGLDELGYFAAINATDDVAPPFLNETDPVKQLNAVTVRRNRICALACNAVEGPKAWEAVN